MINPYTRAPHHRDVGVAGVGDSLHAALLIDFDNVTMGMRSDLSKELKTLLASDVIKGKVSVQRAYADWRRYPQYIVPLSEASVDLIFAPAYGSNKKNATDIRMAIDAVELVFIRPEIGTYILLTGDSDFSSLVLKLKEYGKYVIGVGIQESTSDILVQNCDEYYSYTSLTGLKKTTESSQRAADPWVLVQDALKRMTDRDDVMRSDRLKQVMQEIDPTFDEGGLGFSKFSKFLAEASSRGLVRLHKLENGQYEVSFGRGRSRREEAEDRDGGRRGKGGRGAARERESRDDRAPSRSGSDAAEPSPATPEGADPLRAAYQLLVRSLEELRAAGRYPVRDSDVKRKMLELDPSFDETELGFPKFGRFLGQAVDHEVVTLTRTEAGNEVTLAGERAPEAASVPDRRPGPATEAEAAPAEEPPVQAPPHRDETRRESLETSARGAERVVEIAPSEEGGALGPRRGSTRRRGGAAEVAPVFFEGQIAGMGADGTVDAGGGLSDGDAGEDGFDPAALGLPTDPEAMVRYLTHRYRGVGEKTAESLVDRFGTGLFRVLRDDPSAINDAISPKRAEQVLEAWAADYQRRRSRHTGERGAPSSSDQGQGERGGRRGGRRRGARSRGGES